MSKYTKQFKNYNNEIRNVKGGEIILVNQVEDQVIVTLNDNSKWISDLSLNETQDWKSMSATESYKECFKHMLPKKK